MPRIPGVASLKLRLPLIEQFQGRDRIPDFIPEVICDTAVGVNIVKMLTQGLRQQPGGDGEVLVMLTRQAPAVSPALCLRRSPRGNGVFRGQAAPSYQRSRIRC